MDERKRKESRNLILRSFTTRRHLHQLWIEFTKHRHQITLRCHYLANVLIGHRHFVQTPTDERHTLLLEKTVHVLPIEFLIRGLAAHRTTSAVRRGMQ